MKKHILPLLLLAATHASAQSVKTNFDEKVLYVDSLNLSPNNSVTKLLYVLPELLSRPGMSYTDNYCVLIDDMPVGEAKDAALAQLHLLDVEKIVVSESPLSAYQNNGQGGSINIILRNITPTDNTLAGSLSLDATYPTDIYPQANLGYKTQNLKIRGLMLGELWNTKREGTVDQYTGTALNWTEKQTQSVNFNSQLVRVYMQYEPTSRDCLKFNLSEVSSHEKNNQEGEKTFPQSAPSTCKEQTENLFNLHSFLSYCHTFNPHSKYESEFQYIYSPSQQHAETVSRYKQDNDATTHQLSGKISYTLNLVPTRLSTSSYSDLQLGVSANYLLSREKQGSIDYATVDNYAIERNPHNNEFHVMPFIASESSFGKFRLKLVAEFQHHNYKIRRLDEPYSHHCDDFTGKLMAEWHFTPHKNLRFIADRRLERPTSEQLYPIRMFSVDKHRYVMGNLDLEPTLSHEFSLDYIADYRWGEHKLLFNVSGSYNHVNDIIVTKQEGGTSTGELGLTQEHDTFQNEGTNDIFNANFMTNYSYRFLNIAFTANLFHNEQHVADTWNHYTNYNLILTPTLNLGKGWKTDCNLLYCSKVQRRNETLGHYASSSLSLCKSWNRLSAYIFARVALTSKPKNTLVEPASIAGMAANTTITRQYIEDDKAGIGITYAF